MDGKMEMRDEEPSVPSMGASVEILIYGIGFVSGLLYVYVDAKSENEDLTLSFSYLIIGSSSSGSR